MSWVVCVFRRLQIGLGASALAVGICRDVDEAQRTPARPSHRPHERWLACSACLRQTPRQLAEAYIVMAYIVMAYILMAYILMDYKVMAYSVMAFRVTTYIAMHYIVMAYIVMAYSYGPI